MKNIPPSIFRLTRTLVWLLAPVLLLLVGTGGVLAQTGGDYDLTWWTVDSGGSGGGDSSKQVAGGNYELLSTAGQPEGDTILSGGQYSLKSGFWPGYIQQFATYLPVVLKYYPPAPDLIGSFTLNPAGPTFNAGASVAINVVVTNQGDVSADGFWVDFYINPAATPSVNRRWNDLCTLDPCYGLAWYVSGLAPGQSINLSSTNPAAAYSRWPGYFTGGTSNLQLYVDTWNPGTTFGSVGEKIEENNRFVYPGGVTVTGLALQTEESTTPELPIRPARLEQ